MWIQIADDVGLMVLSPNPLSNPNALPYDSPTLTPFQDFPCLPRSLEIYTRAFTGVGGWVHTSKLATSQLGVNGHARPLYAHDR